MEIIILLGVVGIFIVWLVNRKNPVYRTVGFIAVALGCVLGLLLYFQISYFESARTIILTVALTVVLLVLVYVFLVMGLSYFERKKGAQYKGREAGAKQGQKSRDSKKSYKKRKAVAHRRPAAAEKDAAPEEVAEAAPVQDTLEAPGFATVGELLKEYEEEKEMPQEKLFAFPAKEEDTGEVIQDDMPGEAREPEFADGFVQKEQEEAAEEQELRAVMQDTVREDAEEEPFEFELFELADDEEVQAEQEKAEQEISAALQNAAKRVQSWDYEVVDDEEALVYETTEDGYGGGQGDLWGVADGVQEELPAVEEEPAAVAGEPAGMPEEQPIPEAEEEQAMPVFEIEETAHTVVEHHRVEEEVEVVFVQKEQELPEAEEERVEEEEAPVFVPEPEPEPEQEQPEPEEAAAWEEEPALPEWQQELVGSVKEEPADETAYNQPEEEREEIAVFAPEPEQEEMVAAQMEAEPAETISEVEEAVVIEAQPEEVVAAEVEPEKPQAEEEPVEEEEAPVFVPEPEPEPDIVEQSVPEEKPATAHTEVDLESLGPQERREAEMTQLKTMVARKQYDDAIKKVFKILNAGYVMTPDEKHQMKLILLTLKEKTKK